MASTPILDLAKIDMQHDEFSQSELMEILPHRGHMRQLKRVMYFDRTEWIIAGLKEARDDEFWVAGHIPGRPIMPGVMMLESAAQLSSVLFQFRTGEERFVGFVRCDNVSFRGQVVPGDDLILVSQSIEVRRRRVITNNQGYVDGEMVFEANITGMVF
ncbi:MAG: 3-hydroxyacyl-ACP dehydratase FabZ family protein [Planctomycetota bacterium]